MAQDSNLMTIYALAEALCVSVVTIRRWNKKRPEIPHFRMGYIIRYDLTQVKNWLKEGEKCEKTG